MNLILSDILKRVKTQFTRSNHDCGLIRHRTKHVLQKLRKELKFPWSHRINFNKVSWYVIVIFVHGLVAPSAVSVFFYLVLYAKRPHDQHRRGGAGWMTFPLVGKQNGCAVYTWYFVWVWTRITTGLLGL